MNLISDDQWLDANFTPKDNPTGIRLPDLPPEEVQVRFTGAHGKANLKQAFDFYKFVLQHLPAQNIGQYRLLDFGGGWGRITRFFLRECPADKLVLVDCLTDAIECAQSLNPPFQVVKSDVNPPLPFNKQVTDCCIAFSVFSHLSEDACVSWLEHLSELIAPGGSLVFTTRGLLWFKSIRRSHRHLGLKGALRKLLKRKGPSDYERLIAAKMPHPDEMESRYRNGDFIFCPTGGGGELSESFYGEAWIPEEWIARRYRDLGFKQYQFFPESSEICQCIFVLTKE